MAKDRIIVHLQCGDCKVRNYNVRVAKRRKYGKLELKKYCNKCRKHNPHKETK